jgi:hypothetical protein
MRLMLLVKKEVRSHWHYVGLHCNNEYFDSKALDYYEQQAQHLAYWL